MEGLGCEVMEGLGCEVMEGLGCVDQIFALEIKRKCGIWAVRASYSLAESVSSPYSYLYKLRSRQDITVR